jgi:3D (Asp-Asp-Asp) domain-containing protein
MTLLQLAIIAAASILRPMEITAYCPCEKCCGDQADGITASGYEIQSGDKLIAAPRTFRFGTRMLILGYGIAEVKDRGGAIKGNRLDVFFGTHQEALEWGRQKVAVIILK